MKKLLNKSEISKHLFIFTISIIAIASLLIGMNIQMNYGHYYAVTSGESMQKTLRNGTKLLMKKYEGKELKRGDIVSFAIYIDGEKQSVIKRIIALPNEMINIKGNDVYVDNQLLDEPYAYYSGQDEVTLTLTLSEDEYFVMGDNRMDSLDSRVIGGVPKENITDILFKYKK